MSSLTRILSRKQTIRLALVLLLLGIISLSISRKPLLQGFYPLQKGNYWEYDSVAKKLLENGGAAVLGYRNTETITGVEGTNKGYVVTLETVDKGEGLKEGKGNWYILVSGNDIYQNADKGRLAKNKEDLLYRFPLKVGAEWVGSDPLDVTATNKVYKVVQKHSERIQGKDYDDCYEIAYQSDVEKHSKTFCNGIGLVKELYTDNISEFTKQLVSWGNR